MIFDFRHVFSLQIYPNGLIMIQSLLHPLKQIPCPGHSRMIPLTVEPLPAVPVGVGLRFY